MPDKPITVWADAPGLAQRRDASASSPARIATSAGSRSYPAPGCAAASSMRRANPSPGRRLKLELYRFQLGHTISSQETEWMLGADGEGRFATPPLPAGDSP